MKNVLAITLVLLVSAGAQASGIYECDAVDRSEWLTEERLTQQLIESGWQEVRRMKPDGGCWEVYGTTPDGQRVEGYFDPVTGEQLLLAQRGRILFRKED
ncbi:MAG: PepSY domain-containing protein [Rhodospirillaceae bacterium]|jgi:hypothetical protein|nr:PepSY domain-containing protein [Rhodospirillaceae bacterium]